jgi:hypothetical protein
VFPLDDQYSSDLYAYTIAGILVQDATGEAQLSASLQEIVDKINKSADRYRIIIASRRRRRSALMAEIARQMATRADKFTPKTKAVAELPYPARGGEKMAAKRFTLQTIFQ